MDEDKLGERVYLDILNHARRYVHIMTPYLILDSEMENALIYAAERGVDVRIIMPGIPDKEMAYALAKTYYPALLAAGVRIYEYTPGFVHAKVFTCDDDTAVVGTINLDYRSLYHHRVRHLSVQDRLYRGNRGGFPADACPLRAREGREAQKGTAQAEDPGAGAQGDRAAAVKSHRHMSGTVRLSAPSLTFERKSRI